MGKHITLDDRFRIVLKLDRRETFIAIGTVLGKDCTTISKEVHNHRVFQQSGAPGRAYNACRLRHNCDKRHLCWNCTRSGHRVYCWSCQLCNRYCPNFIEEKYPDLTHAPYVCNGYPGLKKCSLEKCFYKPDASHQEYRDVLSEARQGISLSEQEIKHLDSLISPFTMKG